MGHSLLSPWCYSRECICRCTHSTWFEYNDICFPQSLSDPFSSQLTNVSCFSKMNSVQLPNSHIILYNFIFICGLHTGMTYFEALGKKLNVVGLKLLLNRAEQVKMWQDHSRLKKCSTRFNITYVSQIYNNQIATVFKEGVENSMFGYLTKNNTQAKNHIY